MCENTHRRAAAALLAVAGLVSGAAALRAWNVTRDFDTTPGEERAAPQTWPAASKIQRPSASPVLLLFVHPACSCTKATFSELERLAAREVAGRPEIHVLFETPEGSDAGPQSSLWKRAAALPGASVSQDHEGREARLFGARTSGIAMLYGRDGGLRFEGGITGSRGHEGANFGAEKLLASLEQRAAAHEKFMVFGCALFGGAR